MSLKVATHVEIDMDFQEFDSINCYDFDSATCSARSKDACKRKWHVNCS